MSRYKCACPGGPERISTDGFKHTCQTCFQSWSSKIDELEEQDRTIANLKDKINYIDDKLCMLVIDDINVDLQNESYQTLLKTVEFLSNSCEELIEFIRKK